MSLDKAINKKSEHRKQYYGSKAVDKTCRNHGSCKYCFKNRIYKSNKRLCCSNEKLREYQYYNK